MFLRKIRIGTRLSLGFGLAIVVLAAALGVAGVLAHRDRSTLLQGLDAASQKDRLGQAMRAAMLSSGIGMRNMVLQTQVGPIQKEEARVKSDIEAFRRSLAALGAVGAMSASDRAALEALTELERRLQKPFTQAVALSLAFLRDVSQDICSARKAMLRTSCSKVKIW